MDDKTTGNNNATAGGTTIKDSTTAVGVEVGDAAGSRKVRQDHESKYVQYKIKIKDGGLTDEEVYIYDYVQAKYDICGNSMMYATVVSPIAHLLVDYKNLRQAQIRRLKSPSPLPPSLLTYPPQPPFLLLNLSCRTGALQMRGIRKRSLSRHTSRGRRGRQSRSGRDSTMGQMTGM